MLEPQRVHRDADGDLPAAVTAPLLAHPPSPAEPSPATVGSPEITDEEIDAVSAACCRICLESDSEPGDELISPCMCKGTQQFVHRSCLDHWRSVKEGTAFSHCTTCKARFHLRVESLEDDICRRMKFRLFVARDVFAIFLVIQATIAAIGGMAYFLDKDGSFRNKFSDDWERFLSKHPVPFYYCVGVVAFFVLVGFVGLILHLSSYNNNDPCLVGSRDCCFGWGLVDLPASMEACFAFAVIFVIMLAILGVAYGFFAATVAIQRIWQRHYHILTKKELTKEYVVEDLPGGYTPPKMDPEHEQRLKVLQLM
uniref:Zinc finger-like protein n=1 Tax=Saccharum hybrid cultivar SP80-3280 TaxID=193079 RepID=A0A2R4QN41_9POAL|nr:zinc finger-like protein [Saccharum hybrid cultivar SP80-3280]